MIEKEVKVLNVDLKEMEKKLLNIGAKLISDEKQINIIFDSKNKHIEKNLDGYLRIRETKDNETKKITMTYKKSLGVEKTRSNLEINVTLNSLDEKNNMIKILSELGYHISSIGYKDRKSYLYRDLRFDLDKWDKKTYPHPYMEIEFDKEEDLENIVDVLKLDKKNITTESILQLQKKLI